MNAKELMIGDWVRLTDPLSDGELVQVDCVHPDGFIQYGDGLTQSVEGVPLTADILKANGISLEEVGDNGVSTPAKWRNRYEKWRINTQWRDTNLWYDRLTKKYRIQDTNSIEIEYVHQLQQVLRLAKIDKAIEL